MFHLRHLALPLYLAWGEYVMSTHELLEKEMQTLSHQNSCSTILKSRHGVFQEICLLQFLSCAVHETSTVNIFLLFGMLEKEDQVTKKVGQVHYWTLDINHKLGFDTFSNFDPLKLLGQSGQTMKNSPLPTLKGLPVKTERKHWLRKGLYFILNYFCLGNRVGNGNNSKPGNITDSLARSLITIV